MRPLRQSGLLLILLTLLGFGLRPLQARVPESPLRVAAFNIQVFGQSKIQNPAATRIILHILDRYDLIFIQEIRDSENTAIFELLDRLNAQSTKTYRALISERLGRTSSKEQYAFFYNEDRVAPLETRVFADRYDVFEREPYIGHFRAGSLDFAIVGIHVTPRNVHGELRALNAVYRDTVGAYSHGNVLIMGDLNADCNYYDADKGFQFFDAPATVLIPTGTDTTVAQAVCTYDRVLALGPVAERASRAGAFNFLAAYQLSNDEARAVSDHYPVEFVLDVNDAGNPAAGGTTPNPVPSGPVCGMDPYPTPKGYCFATVGGDKKRVSASCCPTLPAG